MVSVIKSKYETKTYRFAVDTVAELDLLPKINTRGKDILNTIGSCAMGSTAIITENSEEYILNGEQNKWIKKTSSCGGGGGSTDPGEYEIATDEEIRDIFKSSSGGTSGGETTDDNIATDEEIRDVFS